MCIYSKFWKEWEKKNLAPYSIKSDDKCYTFRSEKDSPDTLLDTHGSRSRYRTAFEIDKDRITNCQAFRRLEYKTQVFVTHEGDNYRTRLTHTLEVAEVARHIARALRLNENLVESIALGHDLGHAPYGHIAEKTINDWLQKKGINDYFFCHNNHSLENVDFLEPGYDWDKRDRRDPDEGFSQGLCLTRAVREGILVHNTMCFRGEIHRKAGIFNNYEKAIRKTAKRNINKGLFYPGTLEAQVVKVADIIAHRIHDLEDGLRSKMITKMDIAEVVTTFFDSLDGRLFLEKIKDGNDYIEAKYYKTRISKRFIADIIKIKEINDVEMNRSNGEKQREVNEIWEAIKIKRKSMSGNKEIKELNKSLDDKKYRSNFINVAKVAFLLHMWRDDNYLDGLKDDDQIGYRIRVFKYFMLLKDITNFKKGTLKTNLPAYSLIAFLRGIMSANVIEHSFWNIHHFLDPEFRHFKIEDKITERKKKKHYILFVVVDGIIANKNKKEIAFIKHNEYQRIYCIEFDSIEKKKEFVEKNLDELLATNGSSLLKLDTKIIRKICWLNKSEKPEDTEICKLVIDENNEKWIPIENISIHFTGYKEICPTSKDEKCAYANQEKKKSCREMEKCIFKNSKQNVDVKWPDINMLIGFQDYLKDLDQRLKKLIINRIRNSSRVVRMNNMGGEVLNKLLDTYLENPRIMHERVWVKLRAYPERPNVSKELSDWISKDVTEKETQVIPDELIKLMIDKSKDNNVQNDNNYSLIRRIIEHIAGMTDRYITKEYYRLTMPGKEVELQDETYFFS